MWGRCDVGDWHGYIGIENLGLSVAQREALVSALRALGPALHPLPCMKAHVAVSNDGETVILEALFPTEWLTVVGIKRWLGDTFTVLPDAITHVVDEYGWGGQITQVATFGYGGTAYLRFGVFAGIGGTWEESRQAVIAYLIANHAQWEPS